MNQMKLSYLLLILHILSTYFYDNIFRLILMYPVIKIIYFYLTCAYLTLQRQVLKSMNLLLINILEENKKTGL